MFCFVSRFCICVLYGRGTRISKARRGAALVVPYPQATARGTVSSTVESAPRAVSVFCERLSRTRAPHASVPRSVYRTDQNTQKTRGKATPEKVLSIDFFQPPVGGKASPRAGDVTGSSPERRRTACAPMRRRFVFVSGVSVVSIFKGSWYSGASLRM